MVKLPRLNLNMGVTQKESVLYMGWKAEDISSPSRHCNMCIITATNKFTSQHHMKQRSHCIPQKGGKLKAHLLS